MPPFGWEDVCSYRPLRFLAQMFAEEGIPTLRFDLPGTGDSSGDARDEGLFDAWIRAVGDAADELRIATGVADVAVLGVHMGAMLALMAATRGANLQDLILWGPAATGRTVLRELVAFSKLARAEYANGSPSPAQPIPGLEIGGFLITPETQRSLETLDLLALPSMPGRRVLVLSRDDLQADEKLVAALEAAGCAIEVQSGRGYTAMMAIPEEAAPPLETGRAIIAFLTKEPRPKQPARVTAKRVLSNRRATSPTFESIYTINLPSGSIFGVLSHPFSHAEPNDLCILFLNPGAVRHTGPNRMWVEAARRWAERGVMSLRLDLLGIGESDGEPSLNIPRLYQDRLVKQVETAMESLRSSAGVRRFAVIGLCSGAFWAFHAALRNRDIRAAILLNPRLFFWDPEVDCRRVLRRTARLLTESTDWGRLIRGYVSPESVKRVARIVLNRFRSSGAEAGPCFQISPEGMAQARKALERHQGRVTLIFTEGEPLLREMEEEGHLSPNSSSRLHCIRVANCGHTFRPLWAQQLAHELIDREIEAVLQETPPNALRQGILQTTSNAKT